MLKKSKVPSVARKFLASTLKVFVLPWHRVVQVSPISWRSPAACTAQMYKMTGALNLKPSTISQHHSLSAQFLVELWGRCHGWKKMVQVCPGERHGCRHALLGDPRHDVCFTVTSDSSNADTRLASYWLHGFISIQPTSQNPWNSWSFLGHVESLTVWELGMASFCSPGLFQSLGKPSGI